MIPWLLAQDAAVQHLAKHLRWVNVAHDELDLAIRKQDALARLDVIRNAAVASADYTGLIPHILCHNRDWLALAELDRHVVFQFAGADLGSLQVLQNADGAAEFGCDAAERGNHSRVIIMAAMSEIDTCNIHAGEHQLPDHLPRRARRANRTNNFGPALCRTQSLEHPTLIGHFHVLVVHPQCTLYSANLQLMSKTTLVACRGTLSSDRNWIVAV